MCGILGFVRRDGPASELASLAESWSATMHHRGPDDAGVFVDPDARIALAHRRLSIQDLSAHGAQPMASASGRYRIVFNGELYNFRELSQELAEKGHAFTGHSDTEVLLAAVEEWGLEAAVERFLGMFAFGLWDREARRLTLGRDRFGEKPLYYGWLAGGFVFASELRPILAGHRDGLQVDRDALTGLLRHGWIEAPHTVFRGLHKLLPGTLLELPASAQAPRDFSPQAGAAAISPRRYWDPTELARSGPDEPPLAAEDAVDALDELLHEVIRQQAVADVPLGTFLSGGIDSSLVTAILQAESDRPVRSFTIGFDEGDFNEAGFAKRIAQHLGTDHTELYLGARECLDVVPTLSEHYDEPFADSSQIPALLVSQLARRDVTVCLSGDGGDELFAGYNRYLHADALGRRFARLPGPLARGLGSAISRVPNGPVEALYKGLRKVAPERFGPQPNVGQKLQKVGTVMQRRDPVEIYRSLMSYWQDPAAVVLGASEPPSVYDDPARRIDRPFIEQAMLWDQTSYLPGDNLTKVDRASMAVSLETRLPLLDARVAAFAWRQPLAHRVRDGQSKWLLRRVLDRYVPSTLIDRPKMGFTVPMGAWLRGPLRDWAEALLAEERLASEGFFAAAPIRAMWARHLRGEADHGHPLWAVLAFQDWRERYRVA